MAIFTNNLNKRQDAILAFIEKHKSASTGRIAEYVQEEVENVTRITVSRDLDILLSEGFIQRKGAGRSAYYELSPQYSLLKKFDVDKYFSIGPDQREIKKNFDFEIFNYFSSDVFSQKELTDLEENNQKYQERIKKLSPIILKKELERLTIELSWKSSQIEGNTYSLIDTETLIKEHKEAAGHPKEEAVMILNHKKAIDYILDKRNDFKILSLAKIENLHKLIVGDLGVKFNIRKSMVGITGTNFKPLDNEFQIKETLEKMIKLVNEFELHPLAKALAAILLTSYIQPFEDGNKRTSRILGNAILLAYDYCPLSYRSIDESEYKKAVLLFYEQNSVNFFKELFIQQFKFAVNNYFLA